MGGDGVGHTDPDGCPTWQETLQAQAQERQRAESMVRGGRLQERQHREVLESLKEEMAELHSKVDGVSGGVFARRAAPRPIFYRQHHKAGPSAPPPTRAKRSGAVVLCYSGGHGCRPRGIIHTARAPRPVCPPRVRVTRLGSFGAHLTLPQRLGWRGR